MQVVKVQLATFTIGSGSATGTGTLDGFDDTSKMVVFGSWDLPSRSTSFTGEESMVKLEITSTSVVTATRIGTPAEIINVEAYVIQFGDDTNVYTGTFALTGGGGTSPQTTTANINGGSAMALGDLTKAFCWSYYTDDDSTSNDGRPESQQVQTRFDSTSVIGFERNSNPSALSGRWFAVESSTLTVQHLTSLFTGTENATETAAITTVSDINDTFVISSFFTNESSFKDEGMWTIHLNSDSQLLFTRGFGAANDVGFLSQIIQDSTIATQRGQWVAASTTDTFYIDLDVRFKGQSIVTAGWLQVKRE